MTSRPPGVEAICTAPEDIVAVLSRDVRDGIVTVATLGPAGTSADHVARSIAGMAENIVSVRFEMYPDFEESKRAVLEGRAHLVLVPSAYRDVTSFHWHPRLRLRGAFVHRTPDYGLAVAPGAAPAEKIVLASMSEVRDLFEQLAPEAVRERLVETRLAASTSDAAAMVRAGSANMAVCNDLGRAENELAWFRVRPGVPIVWMLFGLSGSCR